MVKRPKLSSHLRLAETPPPRPEQGRAESPDPPRPSEPSGGTGEGRPTQPPEAAGTELLDILTEATAEMTRLTYLGWSKAWEVQLRLTRYWLGRDRLP